MQVSLSSLAPRLSSGLKYLHKYTVLNYFSIGLSAAVPVRKLEFMLYHALLSQEAFARHISFPVRPDVDVSSPAILEPQISYSCYTPRLSLLH